MCQSELLDQLEQFLGRKVPYYKIAYLLRAGRISKPPMAPNREYRWGASNVAEIVSCLQNRPARKPKEATNVSAA